MINAVRIGQVMTTGNNKFRIHPIYSVRGYGITVPSRFTTNGSAVCAAKWIVAMLNDAEFVRQDIADYTCQVYINEVRYFDEQKLLDVMLSKHKSIWG